MITTPAVTESKFEKNKTKPIYLTYTFRHSIECNCSDTNNIY